MTVSHEVRDGIAIITMNDGKANAINPPVIEAFNAVLDAVEADGSAKAVVLTGLPGKFSAGFDLKYFMSHAMEDNQALVAAGGRIAYRLFNMPKPVIAAVSGHAIAMGIFLVMACDRRIGISGDYKIGANETVNGMVVPRFAMELLKWRLQPHALDEAAVMARLYTPEQAVHVGYLEELVPAEALMETAMNTAARLTELPADAYAGNKRLVREAPLKAMAESLGL